MYKRDTHTKNNANKNKAFTVKYMQLIFYSHTFILNTHTLRVGDMEDTQFYIS